MNEKLQKTRKVNHQIFILVFLAIIGVGIIILLQAQKSSNNTPGPARFKKGLPAPDFALPDLDGKMINLVDYRGKVVFLNIWATWCAPCVEEMPSMEKLHQELKNQDFVILAVSIDESGSEIVSPFMKKHKLTFTALVDTEGTIRNLYQATGIPETFIIDRNGRIAEEVIGPRNWAAEGAVRYFVSLIKEKS